MKKAYGIPVVKANGTKNFADWQMNGQVSTLDEIEVGDVLFKDSAQFDALNLCTVTKKDPLRGNVYARFINPANPSTGRPGCGKETEFCIWDFELSNDVFQNRFIKAVNTAPAPRAAT